MSTAAPLPDNPARAFGRAAGGAALSLLCGALALLCAAGGPAHADVSRACRVPDGLLTFDSDLKHVEQLVDRSAPVRILRIRPQPDLPLPFRGPQSGAAILRTALIRPVPTERAGTPVPAEKAATLESELRHRLPDVAFTVIDERPQPGGAREDFEQIRSAVEATDPDLVIWQLGTGDALAATDPAEFARALEQAAGWIENHGIDLVVLDPPYVPNVPHERLYQRIVRQIDVVSDRDKMNALSQYDATRYLIAHPVPGARGESARRCLPELLAEAIARAATR